MRLHPLIQAVVLGVTALSLVFFVAGLFILLMWSHSNLVPPPFEGLVVFLGALVAAGGTVLYLSWNDDAAHVKSSGEALDTAVPESSTVVRLYVKSVRTITGETQVNSFNSPVGRYDIPLEATYAHVLPENQQRIVDIARKLAVKYSFGIRLMDVGKENVLEREIRKELERIKVFPAFIADSGEKIEGDLTEGQIEVFLLGVRYKGQQSK
jgi:hypothetical protein